jgi:Uma2 family endonuclease
MKPAQFADAEAYLAWEARQQERHEYVDGAVYAMVGARKAHEMIAGNAYVWLRQVLRGGPCRVFASGLKLRVGQGDDFLYPDVMVTCDPRDTSPGEDRYLAHPWLIVEVLSESTAAFDRGRKFELYREIDTLTHYLLVEQDRPHADLFFKNEQSQWVLQPLSAADGIVIERLGQPWPVSTLYEDVAFTPPPAAAAAA